MKYLVSGKEMRLIDKNTSATYKVPELVLMEQAAMAFANNIMEKHLTNNASKKIIIVCGCGNNGADGLAVARLLNMHQFPTTVFLCSRVFGLTDKESTSFAKQKEIYNSYGFPVSDQEVDFSDYDIIVDAVFGVGLDRIINDPYKSLFERINAANSYVIGLDIASGIDSDRGEVLGTAICCNETYTFSYLKLGQILWPGCDYSGEVTTLWIGIDQRSWLDKQPKYVSLEMGDLSNLPKRIPHSNKGTYGKVLVIAGWDTMAGAACLSAKAAYKTGVGLVKVISEEKNRLIIQSQIPEAIYCAIDSWNLDEDKLIEELNWADAIVFGPGMGNNDSTYHALKLVMQNAKAPLVIDADGINVLSQHMELLLEPHSNLILTPHLKEMSRLCRESVEYIQHNLLEVAKDFANRYEVTCVLKDFRTIIAVAYGITYINMTGNNGMATGGSGDVLTGIIGALLAGGMEESLAASFGVLIHGLAGDMITKHSGLHGMTATDIIDGLNILWNQVENNV